MSFFQRLMNYWLNEVLVNSLANSKTFQKFAVRSNQHVGEFIKKTAENKDKVADTGSEFFRVFKEELTKGMTDLQKKGNVK